METKTLLLITEPGGIQIEATSTDGKPALPRFSMLAYTGGAMRVAGWRYQQARTGRWTSEDVQMHNMKKTILDAEEIKNLVLSHD